MPKKATPPKITNNYGSIYIGPNSKGDLTVLRGAARHKYLLKSITQRGRMREAPMLRLDWVREGKTMHLTNLSNLWHWYNIFDPKGESGQRQHGIHGITALWELTREIHKVANKAKINRIETDYTSVGVKPQWGWKRMDEDGPFFETYGMKVMSPVVWERKYPRPVADATQGKKAGAGK